MARYFLQLSYDGTHYCGWQIQPEVNTVQQTLEDTLSIFVPDHKGVIGCGRTDTGVHARKYFAHFDTDLPLRDDLLFKLNAVLPKDIAVHACTKVSDQLHARYSAFLREYKYYLHFRKSPFLNHYSVYCQHELDVESMNQAASCLVGHHDFSSFARSQTQVKHNYCHLHSASWTPEGEGIVFTISANRFLRNMVRAIVGTLIDVGRGKYHWQYMTDVLHARDRNAASKSAYPQGLFLNNIQYPQLSDG